MMQETTVRDFIEQNGLTARLLLTCKVNGKQDQPKELFVDQDSFITENEDEGMIYEAQDLDELVDHGETLANVLNGVQAVFYAPDGGHVVTWFSQEDLDSPMTEDNILNELV